MHQWNPEDYAQNSSQQSKWAHELIEKLEPTPADTVLDIGCGDGKVTAFLAEIAQEVVGIDLSADMIDFARRHFGDTPNLEFHVMDAAAIDLPLKFDLIFSNAALHWVRDQEAVLRGIHDHLKPGGRVLVQMGGAGNAAEVVTAFETVMAGEQWSDYFDGFEFPYTFPSVETYKALLREANLQPLRVELIHKDMQHEGQDGLTSWLRTAWLPYVNRVPEDQRDEFIDTVARDYLLQHPPDTAGIVHVKMVRLEVHANVSNVEE
jgi:trans-aconitate 2-methyltransferase